MNLNPIIISALKPLGIPVGWMYVSADVKTYIRFTVYDEYGDLYADDVEVGTNYHVQVDVISDGSTRTLAKDARSYLEKVGFDHDRTRDDFEEDTLLYLTKMTFIYNVNQEVI
jgi:hypothetical protein